MIIHENGDSGGMYRIPLEYLKTGALRDLMTLKSFIDGGNEIPESKILVCVKSIGAKKIITRVDGVKAALLEVAVFDETAEIVLKLWGDATLSAQDWKPGSTTLLFSSPGFRVEPHRHGTLGLMHHTFVDIDPDFADAQWLRNYAASLRRKKGVKQEFPEGIWDVDVAVNGIHRVLFTIADVDEL
jgi:hypothetical protein